MEKHKTIFNKDLGIYEKDTKVCVTGIIQKKWGNATHFGMSIADLTGTVKVSFAESSAVYDKKALVVGKRVRVWGMVLLNNKEENPYIGKIEKVQILEEISELNKELDIIEQESLVSMSKITNTIRDSLVKNQYVEITTRVISRRMGEEVLEPLMISFPGFGSSIFLSISPSSQLSEFLTVTMLPKVFTVTTSFSSSYRFPNGATELPIILAKAINLNEEEKFKIITDTVNSITNVFLGKNVVIEKQSAEDENAIIQLKKGVFTLVSYKMDIATKGMLWNSVVTMVERLFDDKNNLLMECMLENINDKIDITSITFYPTQFLNNSSKAPKRQIQNLWKIFDGGHLYG